MSEIEDLLKAYINDNRIHLKSSEQKAEKSFERVENKLDQLHAATQRNTNEIELLRQTMAADSKMVQAQIAGLSARLAAVEEDVTDTGVHNLNELNNKLKEQREDKNRALGWMIAFGTSAFLLFCSGVGVVIWAFVAHGAGLK